MQDTLNYISVGGDNYDHKCNNVFNVILNVINEEIPIKTSSKNSKNNSWITANILYHTKERRRLYSKYIKKPITFGDQYRQYRNSK